MATSSFSTLTNPKTNTFDKVAGGVSGIVQGLFGGGRSSSESKNLALQPIAETFGPVTSYTGEAGNLMASLLGGDSSGFDNYKRATGFDAIAERGSRGVTGNAAAGGLLRSGSTGMALQRYGNEIQNQWADSYLNRLMGLGNMGLQSGQLIADAGKYSKSKDSKSSGLLGKFLGFSDPRLKMDVSLIDRMEDGLGIYSFRYIWDDDELPVTVGVMADEVAELRPWALGPEVDGFMTVDYERLDNESA